MLFDALSELNWLAVIVAALAYWILGAIWFSPPLFRKQWQEATGKDMSMPEPKQIVGNLLLWFIAALGMAMIANRIGADDALDGTVLGFVASFGFIGTNRINEGLYMGTDKKLMMVNAPYTLLGFVIMGIILSTWR